MTIRARFRHYAQLRANGLHPRLCASMSGVDRILTGALRDIAILLVAIAVYLAASSTAEAIQSAADNRVAAIVTSQSGEINALREIVAKCLGEREGVLVIGGEYFLCRAVSIGERQ